MAFRALYEFVDLHEDGEPYGTGPCSRRFTSPGAGTGSSSNLGEPENQAPHFRFQAPRNIFLYGRGGACNMRLVQRTILLY